MCLTAILLTAPMAVLADIKVADAKNEVIDQQQKMTQEAMDTTKKATPHNEQRPAVTTDYK